MGAATFGGGGGRAAPDPFADPLGPGLGPGFGSVTLSSTTGGVGGGLPDDFDPFAEPGPMPDHRPATSDAFLPPRASAAANALPVDWGIDHLALNHLSVAGGEDGALALRELLRLHDLRDTAESRAALAALLVVEATPGVARLPGGRPGSLVRGLDVTLTFDAGAWSGGGLYLMTAVLERFLTLQVSVNAFVRSSVVLRGRPGSVARFAPRSGTRVLL